MEERLHVAEFILKHTKLRRSTHTQYLLDLSWPSELLKICAKVIEEEYSYCRMYSAPSEHSRMKFTLYIPILQKLADTQELWALTRHLLNTAPQSTIFPQRGWTGVSQSRLRHVQDISDQLGVLILTRIRQSLRYHEN